MPTDEYRYGATGPRRRATCTSRTIILVPILSLLRFVVFASSGVEAFFVSPRLGPVSVLPRTRNCRTVCIANDISCYRRPVSVSVSVRSAPLYSNQLSLDVGGPQNVTSVVQPQQQPPPQREQELQQQTTVHHTNTGVPSYKTILVFVGSTVLIWLSEPLLSLVDTTVVGKCTSGSLELAALGPATMMFDSCIYLTYFLAIAATNQVASALAAREASKTDAATISTSTDEPTTTNPNRVLMETTSHVLGVGAVLGALITIVSIVWGLPLLTWIVGTPAGGGVEEARSVVLSALSYVRIRSYSAPFAVMGMVAQSIALACLDTRTPLVAVTVASIINIVGDIGCVAFKGWGIQGAALATAVATTVSSLILLFQTCHTFRSWRSEHDSRTGTSQPSSWNMNGEGTPSDKVKGDSIGTTSLELINDHPQQQPIIPFISLPDKKALVKLVKLSGPIFFVILGKLVIYSAMTMRATDFGMIPLACHNVMLRVFFFYATFGDAISQAAQTFLPNVLFQRSKQERHASEPNNNNNGIIYESTNDASAETTTISSSSDGRINGDIRKKKTEVNPVKQLVNRLLVFAGIIGVVNSMLVKVIVTRCGSYFTNDLQIISLMGKHSGSMAFATLLHGFVMLFEGAIIATSDWTYLVGTYGVTMWMMLSYLYVGCHSFGGVWFSLMLFQSLRLIQFGTRVWKKTVVVKQETQK
eukprot:scaffold23241_cov56-Attheya_sp.AAC.4